MTIVSAPTEGLRRISFSEERMKNTSKMTGDKSEMPTMLIKSYLKHKIIEISVFQMYLSTVTQSISGLHPLTKRQRLVYWFGEKRVHLLLPTQYTFSQFYTTLGSKNGKYIPSKWK